MAKRIEKVAVIGSGIMGGGIAALCASAGIPTVLLDIVPFDLKDEEKNDPKARNRIVENGLKAQLKAKPPAFMDKKHDVKLIETGNLDDDFDKLKDCDLIVEVVIENLEIKQNLFKKIDAVKKPDAIVTSNTSGLLIKDMTEGLSQGFKKNFLVTHFFNPVRVMKLLEVVPGKETKPEVLNQINAWGEKILGKGIVVGKDTPNFIGNRIGVYFICEAFKLLEKKPLELNLVDKIFGPPFGFPKTGIFALGDMVGLDTIGHLSENSFGLLENDECRDVYQLPDYVKKMLEKGMYGKKTKEAGGFYHSSVDMKTWKRINKVLDITTLEFKDYDRRAPMELADATKKMPALADKQKHIVYSDGEYAEFAWNLVANTLIYAANRVPEIADTIVEIDNAMKWGYAWEAGPFEIWDNLGLKESVEKMKATGKTVPENIETMLSKGNETFFKVVDGKKQYYDLVAHEYKDVVYADNMLFLANIKADKSNIVKSNKSCNLVDLGDGVFCFEFQTKMNAINGEIVDSIAEFRDYVSENGVGMVIGNQSPGMPGAFCAGGDLGYMGGLAKEGKWSEMEAFLDNVHKNIFSLKYSFFPVVAAPYGMTLGGGVETCLASDKIVAHEFTFMGLVEIGAGILPAGGGCTNYWRRTVEGLPKQVQLSKLGDLFVPVFKNVAMASVSNSAAEARNMGYLRSTDRIVFNKDYLIGEAKKEVLKMVDDGYAPPAKTKIPVIGQEGQGMVAAELANMQAGGFITPHMAHIAKRIAYVISGGNAIEGMEVSEDYMLSLEKEVFLELWHTENTQKMAEHILKTGKPLMI